MQYKICLVKNRITNSFNVNKYMVEWFTKNTPLEIIVDTITTDFDVTTKDVGNATYHGVVCGDDIMEKVKTVVPEGKYNCVVFVYGNDLNGIRVSTTTGSFYKDTEFIQTFKVDDNGAVINHEMFHAFFFKAHKCQINVVDNMDTYVGNSDLSVDSVVNTNREVALKSLAPYWNQICAFRSIQTPNVVSIPPKIDTKPTVTLERFSDNNIEALGDLSFNSFTCQTLERPWKNNQKNISCIPIGTYQVKYTFSSKFLKYTYEVLNVPNRSGIRIHSGNYFFDIEGCILLGDSYSDINKDGQKDVLNSRVTIKKFEDLMQKRPFTLKIV